MLEILTISLPESIMKRCSVVLTFESVDKILWCDHSNETSSAVLLHGTICFLIFCKMNFEIFLYFDVWHSWEIKGQPELQKIPREYEFPTIFTFAVLNAREAVFTFVNIVSTFSFLCENDLNIFVSCCYSLVFGSNTQRSCAHCP